MHHPEVVSNTLANFNTRTTQATESISSGAIQQHLRIAKSSNFISTTLPTYPSPRQLPYTVRLHRQSLRPVAPTLRQH